MHSEAQITQTPEEISPLSVRMIQETMKSAATRHGLTIDHAKLAFMQYANSDTAKQAADVDACMKQLKTATYIVIAIADNDLSRIKSINYFDNAESAREFAKQSNECTFILRFTLSLAMAAVCLIRDSIKDFELVAILRLSYGFSSLRAMSYRIVANHLDQTVDANYH